METTMGMSAPPIAITMDAEQHRTPVMSDGDVKPPVPGAVDEAGAETDTRGAA